MISWVMGYYRVWTGVCVWGGVSVCSGSTLVEHMGTDDRGDGVVVVGRKIN